MQLLISSRQEVEFHGESRVETCLIDALCSSLSSLLPLRINFLTGEDQDRLLL